MIEVRATLEFDQWLGGLRDVQARARIIKRIERLKLGNFGDVRPVGSGVSELRIHYGPGYRVYLMQRGSTWVLLLCGGDKSTQATDIAAARSLADSWKD